MTDTALILIDIQNDYFPGGQLPVPGMEAAAAKAAQLLQQARHGGGMIVHIRHESTRPGAQFFLPGTTGADIHASVQPDGAEPVLTKSVPNSFIGTGLHDLLQAHLVRRLTLCGAMSQMCIDATARAARDLGYDVTVAADACAARPQSFGGRDVEAGDVHAAFMAALSGVYARIVTVADILPG